MSTKIKTYFLGTSSFGVPSLEALIKDGKFEIAGVITQPDKKAGRNMKMSFSPIKLAGSKLGLNVWQPINIADFTFPNDLDIIVVAAYGQILPEKIIKLPRYGCVNVHGSLLPKYRGASCVQAPILAGDNETGISIIKMDEKLDTGPIISQEKIYINQDETAGSLYKKLAELAGGILPSVLKLYVDGKIKPRAQIEADSSYAKKITKDSARINWESEADYLERFIRAMHPWPGAFTAINGGGIFKILEAGGIALDKNKNEPGILFREDEKLYAQCSNGALELKTVQLPGKRPTSAADFLNGYPQYIGRQLQ